MRWPAGLADVYVNLGVRGYIAPQEVSAKAKSRPQSHRARERLPKLTSQLGQAYVAFVPCNFLLGDVNIGGRSNSARA